MPPRPPYRKIIIDEITKRINERAAGYLPGDQLPYDGELAAEFGCSIGPVKSAMELLSDRGLIERHQGKGTFVAEHRKIVK